MADTVFFDFIGHIVGVCPKEQMIWVYARFYVTFVKNVRRPNGAMNSLICGATGSDGAALQCNLRITF